MDDLRTSVLVCVTLLSAVGASPALGCSCGTRFSVAEALADANLVFEGRVINTWPMLVDVSGMNYLGQRYTFRVNSKWKGATGGTVTLVDALGNCSFPFHRGESYIVFAYAIESTPDWSTSICTRTIATVSAAGIARELGGREIVSNDYRHNAEALLHMAARRLMIATLGVKLWHQNWWRSLEDSPRGVVLRYCLQVSVLGYLVVIAAIVSVGRWRVAVMMLLLPLVAGGLIAFFWSYAVIVNNPGYAPLLE